MCELNIYVLVEKNFYYVIMIMFLIKNVIFLSAAHLLISNSHNHLEKGKSAPLKNLLWISPRLLPLIPDAVAHVMDKVHVLKITEVFVGANVVVFIHII